MRSELVERLGVVTGLQSFSVLSRNLLHNFHTYISVCSFHVVLKKIPLVPQYCDLSRVPESRASVT